jgi:hypothetical protein
MTLIIGDNFYATAALHTEGGKEKAVRRWAYLQVWNKGTHATQE